jgi:hypothetical protein
MAEITSTLKDIARGKEVRSKIHIGLNIFASQDHPYRGIHVRKWNLREGELTPGFGVFLSPKAWESLCDLDKVLNDIIPQLKDITPCYMSHDNQMSAFECCVCNPNKNFL